MTNNSQRILLMGHVDGLGGAQTAFRKLYDFMKGEGHRVKVVVLSDRSPKEQLHYQNDLLSRVRHTTPFLTQRMQKTADLLYAGWQARAFNPQIFVSVGLSNSANILARSLNKHCFKIGQDFIANRDSQDGIWRASRGIMNGLAVQAPSMMDHGQKTLHTLTGLNWLPCFPESPVADVIRSQRSADTGKVKLVYFGRLANNKGLPLLLQSLADASIPHHVKLDLWGEGAEGALLQQMTADLGLSERVRFRGSYPVGEEGARLMASYDALVLPSTRLEGLPLVLLEAMAYGLPFLTTDVGAIRDCCINNPDAVMVAPTSAGISQGLRALLAHIHANTFDPLRLQRFYEQTFSATVMASRWQQCLQNPYRFFYETR
jgi:glycosyltransferase involved in cell wall biosynthesis